jgi:heterodisulfide reductase subunit C
VWEWIHANDEAIFGRYSECYGKEGAGALRKVDEASMEEIRRIFEVSGGKAFYDTIEAHSDRKAREMGYDGATHEYMMEVFTLNSDNHY